MGFLNLNSLAVGKIGALLASIPVALAASVLCFTWALIVALGLSTLRYTQAASSRNMIIVGFTLFISLSIPAYFQQYEPSSTLILPSYLLPYAAASSGPVRTASSGVSSLPSSVSSWKIFPSNYCSNSTNRLAAELCSKCTPIHQRRGGSPCGATTRQHGAWQQAGARGLHLVRPKVPGGGSCDLGTLPVAREDLVLVQVG